LGKINDKRRSRNAKHVRRKEAVNLARSRRVGMNPLPQPLCGLHIGRRLGAIQEASTAIIFSTVFTPLLGTRGDCIVAIIRRTRSGHHRQ
jgi:hypothetical protein